MHWRRVARAEGRESAPVWDERRRENYQRRRALKRGADAEQITNVEVFERDGWVCGLCFEPVDRAVLWPDPLSASLDHILPLSRGGSHTLANVQLAHLGCNVEKGARVAA
jgi:5-methylcytosine-specific restriction endonuclease McrA